MERVLVPGPVVQTDRRYLWVPGLSSGSTQANRFRLLFSSVFLFETFFRNVNEKFNIFSVEG